MAIFIKAFADDSYIEYDSGRFDAWCVYYVDDDGNRRPPRDVEYFEKLQRLANKYGSEKIYEDFVEVYIWAGKEIDPNALDDISALSFTYDDEDSLLVDKVFSIMYAAMIAEERKANAILGKRIKRLGVYTLLFENKTADYAARFMIGRRARELAILCEERGF